MCWVLQIEDGEEYNHPDATDEHRVAIFSPPFIEVAAASASSAQIRGYLATIAFTLAAPAADTIGALTVTFPTNGILGDEGSGVVSGVSGAGDFTCTPALNRCVHTFASEDNGEESLSLVLSLAIGGDLRDVSMAFSGTASGYAVRESTINLSGQIMR